MLINPTLQKLNDLGLSGMAVAFGQQLEQPEYLELSFEDRLGLLVDREAQDRDNRRLQRNLKTAKLRAQACIEDLDFRTPRGLDRSTVLGLAEAHWVEAHRDILVTGATGVGKTFLACALAQAALRHRHRVLYLRVPRLLEDVRVARADGRLPRLLASWSRFDVLVLDDLALRPLAAQQAADLLEIIEDRHQRRFHHRRQPAPRLSLARGPRRADRGRCHPRPAGSRRLPNRAPGRLFAAPSARTIDMTPLLPDASCHTDPDIRQDEKEV